MISHMVWCHRKNCGGECSPAVGSYQLRKLEAENERLREALESILSHHSHSPRCELDVNDLSKCEMTTVESIARAALSHEENKDG